MISCRCLRALRTIRLLHCQLADSKGTVLFWHRRFIAHPPVKRMQEIFGVFVFLVDVEWQYYFSCHVVGFYWILWWKSDVGWVCR